MEKDEFFDLGNLRVSCKEGNFIIGGVRAAQCEFGKQVLNTEELAENYFGKMIDLRGVSGVKRFLQENPKITLSNGIVFQGENITIKEG